MIRLYRIGNLLDRAVKWKNIKFKMVYVFKKKNLEMWKSNKKFTGRCEKLGKINPRIHKKQSCIVKVLSKDEGYQKLRCG